MIKMHFVGFLLLMLAMPSRGHVPVETVMVQVQSWGVVDAQQLKGHVLFNGAFIDQTTQEVDGILKSISVDINLQDVMGANLTSALRTCTVLRSRECILEGSELHWSDRVFCDGEVYLTLDHNDTWTPHVPQAMALKVLWDQEVGRTKMERIRLQDGCFRLMRELGLSVDNSVPETLLPRYVIPVLCILSFAGLIIISLLLSKGLGLRHPGGVIGSVIHYPQGLNEGETKIEGRTYRTL